MRGAKRTRHGGPSQVFLLQCVLAWIKETVILCGMTVSWQQVRLRASCDKLQTHAEVHRAALTFEKSVALPILSAIYYTWDVVLSILVFAKNF